MVSQLVSWLDDQSFGVQILVLAGFLDPIGAAAGYFLLPEYGIEPLLGAVYGLVASAFVVSAWVLRYVMHNEREATDNLAE